MRSIPVRKGRPHIKAGPSSLAVALRSQLEEGRPMNLLNILSQEHQIFRDLIERMERSLNHAETAAREELRDTFLILLPALGRHERIENLIFRHPIAGSNRTGVKLFDEIERQHRDIESLRLELRQALAQSDRGSFEQLKSLAFEIGEKLRLRFRTEETKLWPNYRLSIGRLRESAVAKRALVQVRELERSVERSRATAAGCPGGRR